MKLLILPLAERGIIGTVQDRLTHVSVSNKCTSSKPLWFEFLRILTIAPVISGIREVLDMVTLVRVS